MPDVALVYSRLLASDGEGGKIESWTTQRARTKCRLVFVGNNPRYEKQIVAAGIKASEAFLIALPLGTGVVTTDRLVIGSATYAVVTDAGTRSYQMADRFLVRGI